MVLLIPWDNQREISCGTLRLPLLHYCSSHCSVQLPFQTCLSSSPSLWCLFPLRINVKESQYESIRIWLATTALGTLLSAKGIWSIKTEKLSIIQSNVAKYKTLLVSNKLCSSLVEQACHHLHYLTHSVSAAVLRHLVHIRLPCRANNLNTQIMLPFGIAQGLCRHVNIKEAVALTRQHWQQ